MENFQYMNTSMKEIEKSNNIDLVKEISLYIEESKQQLAITVNATLSLLYWQIGKRINEEILQNQRAEYGKEIVSSLAQALSIEFGKGWSEKLLRHCLRTAETFKNKEIFYALSRELSWTHIRSVIYIEDDLKRDFYIEMCKLEKSIANEGQIFKTYFLPSAKISFTKLNFL